MDMEPPVTPKIMPASAAELPLDHTKKLFGIVYITLMGVIDTIVPAASLWSWVGKSISYLIKLAPILWWALPAQFATCQFPNASKLANQGWFPEKVQDKTGVVCHWPTKSHGTLVICLYCVLVTVVDRSTAPHREPLADMGLEPVDY
ncbi:hypothetical protein DSO57_1027669 [Entomophthora muscae]|uniref:Uncharacterized protein n=1 Tax=Entomophthora muscae TaxID=34485 RepID=A0ACC2RGE3_9FUNG|nr:hypothetical protein DSO57_1027669 [Entomophthora muscae]